MYQRAEIEPARMGR